MPFYPDETDEYQVGWWTRTQRIRTAAQIPLEIVLLDTGATPTYQRIASKALHLQQLGMSCSAIARRLSVTDKTVAKAIAWLRQFTHYNDEQNAKKRQNGDFDE
jgi:hypothetical protein